MQDELHGKVAYHGVQLLLLVCMILLLAIPKSLLILKEFYTLVYTVFAYPNDYSYITLIIALSNTTSLN